MRNDPSVKTIKENLARAKAALLKEEYLRAADNAHSAFELKARTRLMPPVRYEVDYLLEEFCNLFSNDKGVRSFLESKKIRARPFLKYTPGQEKRIAGKLSIFATERACWEEYQAAQSQEADKHRLMELFCKAEDAFAAENKPRARAYLKRIADEYGTQEGVLLRAGRMLLNARLPMEAMGLLKRSVERFPNEPEGYQQLVLAYRAQQEWEKAEDIYLRALKIFGAHPRTYLNLATLYLDWRKRDKAYHYARQAYEADASLTEAKAIVDKMDGV